MRNYHILMNFSIVFILGFVGNSYGGNNDTIVPRYKVTLSQAHIGNLEVDMKLLESYEVLPQNIRQFYLDARAYLSNASDANFTNPEIINAAQRNNLPLMSGPMLGVLTENSVTIWLRAATANPVSIRVTKPDGSDEKTYTKKLVYPGVEQKIVLAGLSSDTHYNYAVYDGDRKIAGGGFKTAPPSDQKGIVRLAFGSDFHKIGLHNPNLIHQILNRKPLAMLLIGDIAVDDRENRINMHRADYLLRDLSKAWQQLSANVPLYAIWDDHDYFNNDLSGIPKGFTATDRESVRAVWRQNWNNPENQAEGIYFNTRIGPAEIFMLDTRSCRENERRGQYGSFLGRKQLAWLKETLKKSTAPFKIISSGTMWSDYTSGGKDSWGTWDIPAREEIFSFIENENISGILLISGDRHGARGFTIPRSSGFAFYEFEAGTLGGVPGPESMAKDSTNQLFGYNGTSTIAFGEFTFDTTGDDPLVTFRLIDQYGSILEKHSLSYQK